jgi:adenylyl-sulfate kinase
MERATIWLTGLSGSGKSTIAEKLKKNKSDIVLLDGDALRKGLCSDLGFSIKDRKENMRRLRALCKLFNENGKDVITACISPFEEDRVKAKEEIPNCKVVWCNSSFEKCEERDVKGLYTLARKGLILFFTGMTSPFEEAACADLTLDTENESVETCVRQMISLFFSDRVTIALNMAVNAHLTQKRWGGEPYITHPTAVADMCETEDQKIVALLHDTIEDTTLTDEDISKQFEPHIVDAVDAMTKREGGSYKDYILSLKNNELARYVKIRDIKHNMQDLDSKKKIDRVRIARYELALFILGEY